MTIYIANENGDWWTFDPNDALYILDTNNLPEQIAKNWQDETGDISWIDADTIREYGQTIPQSKLLE